MKEKGEERGEESGQVSGCEGSTRHSRDVAAARSFDGTRGGACVASHRSSFSAWCGWDYFGLTLLFYLIFIINLFSQFFLSFFFSCQDFNETYRNTIMVLKVCARRR